MTTVILTRHQRDVLYGEIVFELSGALGDIASSLKHGRGSGLRDDERERAERAMRLLDDLGWDRLDPREVYPVAMPADELAVYALSRIKSAEGALRDNAPDVAVASTGADPWQKYRQLAGGSADEDIRQLRELVDLDLDVLAVCRSILAQLGEPETA